MSHSIFPARGTRGVVAARGGIPGRRRGPAALLILLLCWSLAGCGGHAVPAEEPALPSSATFPDAAGAEAFVRHWYRMLDWAMTSGDTDGLQRLSHPECGNCTAIIENTRNMHAGGEIAGGMSFVHQSAVLPDSPGNGTYFVQIQVTEQPIAQTQADGTQRTTNGVLMMTVHCQVSYREGRWYMETMHGAVGPGPHW